MSFFYNIEGKSITKGRKKLDVNSKQIMDAMKCLGEIDYTSLLNESNNTIVQSKFTRLDIQRELDGAQNIKMHLNNEKDKEPIIAQVILNSNILKKDADEYVQSNVLRKVKYGLTRSLENGECVIL